jgi:hypothetical protein
MAQKPRFCQGSSGTPAAAVLHLAVRLIFHDHAVSYLKLIENLAIL